MDNLDKKGFELMRKINFYICIGIFLAIFLLALTGCANYSLKHENVETVTKKNGSVVVTSYICNLSISSMREVQAADINISKGCELEGNAKKMGANENLIDLMSSVVRKIP